MVVMGVAYCNAGKNRIEDRLIRFAKENTICCVSRCIAWDDLVVMSTLEILYIYINT